MKKHKAQSGFTLIELMIVVAIIAIIASIGIPKLMSARVSANETAAIATLRSLTSAQAQIQSSGALDTNTNGAGEYAYFAELAGTKPLRIRMGGVAALGTPGIDELSPSILAAHFGNVDPNGFVTRSGYYFAIYLPDGSVTSPIAGIPEAPGGGGGGVLPGSANGEIYWCCYAWPIDANGTGTRAFFVNDEGEILQCNNRSAAPFDGTTKPPTFDECYRIAGDMSSGTNVGVASVVSGQVWKPTHN